MYCGKCNAYIPELPDITDCFECGISIEDARLFQEEMKRRELASQAMNKKAGIRVGIMKFFGKEISQ